MKVEVASSFFLRVYSSLSGLHALIPFYLSLRIGKQRGAETELSTLHNGWGTHKARKGKRELLTHGMIMSAERRRRRWIIFFVVGVAANYAMILGLRQLIFCFLQLILKKGYESVNKARQSTRCDTTQVFDKCRDIGQCRGSDRFMATREKVAY